LNVALGGTGQTSFTAGDIILGSGGNTALTSTSVLAVNKGGSGASTLTGVHYSLANTAYSATTVLAQNYGGTGVNGCTSGQVIRANAQGKFECTTLTSTTDVTEGTNLYFTSARGVVAAANWANPGTATGTFAAVTSTILAASTKMWCPVSDAPIMETKGMFAIDTSEDQWKYRGTATHILSPTSSFSFAMSSSTSFVTDDPNYEKLLLRRAPYDLTITKISCATDAGTQVIGLYEAAPVTITNLATNGVDGSTTITCDSDGQDDDGSLSNPSIDRGDWIGLYFGTADTSPKRLSVSVEYVVTEK
jgi:hypothetical protein